MSAVERMNEDYETCANALPLSTNIYLKYHGFDNRKGLVVRLFIFSGFYVAAASVIRRATNVANLNFKTLRFTC